MLLCVTCDIGPGTAVFMTGLVYPPSRLSRSNDIKQEKVSKMTEIILIFYFMFIVHAGGVEN